MSQSFKAVLHLELVGDDKPTEEWDGSETYVDLVRNIKLPFAPQPGMRLMLPESLYDDAARTQYQKVLDQTTEVAINLFEIEKVTFDVASQSFDLYLTYTYESHTSLDGLQSIVDQLVFGFGFTVTK